MTPRRADEQKKGHRLFWRIKFFFSRLPHFRWKISGPGQNLVKKWFRPPHLFVDKSHTGPTLTLNVTQIRSLTITLGHNPNPKSYTNPNTRDAYDEHIFCLAKNHQYN